MNLTTDQVFYNLELKEKELREVYFKLLTDNARLEKENNRLKKELKEVLKNDLPKNNYS